jgi:hypothetical protein
MRNASSAQICVVSARVLLLLYSELSTEKASFTRRHRYLYPPVCQYAAYISTPMTNTCPHYFVLYKKGFNNSSDQRKFIGIFYNTTAKLVIDACPLSAS